MRVMAFSYAATTVADPLRFPVLRSQRAQVFSANSGYCLAFFFSKESTSVLNYIHTDCLMLKSALSGKPANQAGE